jgi:hypothetical protein
VPVALRSVDLRTLFICERLVVRGRVAIRTKRRVLVIEDFDDDTYALALEGEKRVLELDATVYDATDVLRHTENIALFGAT